MFRIFLALFVVVVVAAVYAFLPKPVPVDAVPIQTGLLRVTVDEDGKTRIKDRYIVSAPLAGQLRRISLDEGQAVEAGKTLLAVIDPMDPDLLDARAIAEAEARVQAAQAAVKQSAANLERAQAALDFAKTDYERVRRAVERDAMSQQKLDESLLLYRTRIEEERAARFAQEIAAFELQQAQAALLRSRPDSAPNHWHVEIRSPISGRVLRVMQESAGVVSAGTELLELGDPADLELVIDVLSTDAVAIRPGAEVLIEHWGGEKTLTGTVRLVEPQAFTKISALGVEEQRVNVIVDLLDPRDQWAALGDGYRIEARIVVWEQNNVLRVPTSALFRHGDDWAVYMVVADRAQLRVIRIGRRNADYAQVLAGLEAGDLVILHPSDKIRDGVAVSIP